MLSRERGHLFFVGHIRNERQSQGRCFRWCSTICSADRLCRVIHAFVVGLRMSEPGFERCDAAETVIPGTIRAIC